MPHAMPLMATLVAALSAALLLGVIARKLNLPPIVGYLLAGIAIGPHTPGFAGDMELAAELAEIGIVLLMFGVGLHFSPQELADARGVALPGAIGQMLVATLLGWGMARLLGWGDGAGLIFGLSLSVASTVVLLRALQERGEERSPVGHIAVGWLVVEDLAMVLALVLAPIAAGLLDGAAAPGLGLLNSVGVTLAKVAAFVALMLVVGARVLPWCLSLVGGLRSRELFSLAALVAAIGVAFAAYALFEVSLALGAFLAGMVLGQSPLSQKAAEQTLPLRDAFAVLFFVSVGMLFEPAILWTRPLEVAGTLGIVLGGKAAAWGIARALGQDHRAALTIAAALAQIGEFSFILAGLGVAEGLLPPAGRDLVLAAALLSIGLNPLLFRLGDRLAGPKPAAP